MFTDLQRSQGIAWVDYNQNGFLDVFVANQNSQNNSLHHNCGDGTFTKIITGNVVTDGGISFACTWGDYDNDGHLDLFVSNVGNNFLYHNNGNGTFTKITTGDIVTDGGDSYGGNWVDYDK